MLLVFSIGLSDDNPSIPSAAVRAPPHQVVCFAMEKRIEWCKSGGAVSATLPSSLALCALGTTCARGGGGGVAFQISL